MFIMKFGDIIMERIQLEGNCVEKVKVLGRVQVWFSFICGILIILFSTAGCSDIPYSGPVLSVDHVDRYLDSTGEDTICLQDGFDSICIRVLLEDVTDATGAEAPIVYVHPTSLTYKFYYENIPLLRAERLMDTTDIIQDLVDAGKVELPVYSPAGIKYSAPSKWNIQIYYPIGFPETERGTTLQTSGFNIKVAAGIKLRINPEHQLQIDNFRQINNDDGTRGVQFTIDTEAPQITIHVDGLVPEHTAKFYLNVNGVVSDDGTNVFQLDLLQ